MEEKERIEWLEERELKLRQLESMINKMQGSINNNDDTSERYFKGELDLEELYDKNSNIKMEIFKLWYYVRYGKEYEL